MISLGKQWHLDHADAPSLALLFLINPNQCHVIHPLQKPLMCSHLYLPQVHVGLQCNDRVLQMK